MGLQDLIVTPLFLIVIYFLAFMLRGRFTNQITRKYFIPALTIKFIGAIGLGLIYQFYYGGGDTFNYWVNGKHIYEALLTEPSEAFKLLIGDIDSNLLFKYRSKIWLIRSDSAFFIVKLSGFIDLFTFHTYTANSLFFALFSFSGTWAMFQLLTKKYPNNLNSLLLALFLMPSIIVWGSGILKDSIALGALFWLVWGVIRWIDYKKKDFIGIVAVLLGAYLLYSVKVYILLCVFPCLLFVIFLKYYRSFKSVVLKIVIAPVFIIVLVGLSLTGVSELSQEDSRYQIENIATSSKITAYDLKYGWGSKSGSGYSLGEHSGTWVGMVSLAPMGIITAIYRPFIWEASNVLMLIAALESLFITFLSFKVLFTRQVGIILKDPFLLFCLVFSIIFAFAVGVSTFNFGTLSRYRLPLIPFHLLAITIKQKATS